jgi:nicotinate-nucleotide adenylyltransferase
VTRRPARIGVFGGTFDPIHVGHLIVAEEVLSRMGLEKVLFMPAPRPAHKRSRVLTSVEHRIAMLKLAIQGNPRFSVSRIEADGPGISFTARTLETLVKKISGEFYFIMGQDSLEEFHSWRDPEQITRLARLVVVPRGEGELSSLGPALRRRVVFLRPPRIGISSTEIRRRLRRGLPVRYWIPDAVLRYVTRHGLYGIRGRG